MGMAPGFRNNAGGGGGINPIAGALESGGVSSAGGFAPPMSGPAVPGAARAMMDGNSASPTTTPHANPNARLGSMWR